jgi:hypothetical protein
MDKYINKLLDKFDLMNSYERTELYHYRSFLFKLKEYPEWTDIIIKDLNKKAKKMVDRIYYMKKKTSYYS